MLRPRKQTIVISVACLIVVLGVAVYVYYPMWKNSQNSAHSKSLALGVTTSANMQTISTSTDSDWQKTFFSLPSITRDGASTTASSTAPENLTQTDVLGRNFFMAYTQLRQAGLSSDPDSVNKAAAQLADDAAAQLRQQKIYTLLDINVSQINTAAAIQAYAVTGQKILATLPPPEEATIATNALESRNYDELKNIDQIILAYQNALKELITMPVPSLFASDHVNLVNAISMEVFDAQGLRQVDIDPVRGLAALSQELTAMQGIIDSVQNIQKSLVSAGILFQ